MAAQSHQGGIFKRRVPNGATKDASEKHVQQEGAIHRDERRIHPVAVRSSNADVAVR